MGVEIPMIGVAATRPITADGAQLNGASQTIRHLTAFTAPPCLDSRGSERLISRLAVLIVAG